MIWDDAAILGSTWTSAEDAQTAKLLENSLPLCLRDGLAWCNDLAQAARDVVLEAGEVLGAWHVRSNNN